MNRLLDLPFFTPDDINFFMGGKSSYPLHNIIKKEDGKTVLELAVAGYDKSNIEVALENGVLQINGKKTERKETFIEKQISEKAFTRRFTVRQGTNVESANLENGILAITLDHTNTNRKLIEVN